jgi:pimeloyl-ACP methyl ester carboxylesterase
LIRGEVVVDGRRLETARWETPGATQTILLLHEGLGSVSLWRDFPAALAARTGRSVVAYSRRGYGSSEPLEGPREVAYMHEEGEAVVPRLLDALGLERPVLFGHSDGASIAIIAEAARPGLASALILEAPHVFVEDLSVRSIDAARTAWATTDLRERLQRHHADVDGAFRGWNDIWLDPRFRAWNIEGELAAVQAPMLVIQGDADEYGTLAQVESIVARAPQAEAFIIPGARHSPHRDAPDLVLERVAGFLRRAG